MTLPPRPFQQGQLDALCGVYAVINAMRLLFPEIDRRVARELFRELVLELRELVDDPIEVVIAGMDPPTVRSLLDHAARYVEATFDGRVAIGRLPRFDHVRSLEQLWRSLRKSLSGDCVAVFAAYGHHNHWTVAAGATERSLLLFDSSDLRALLRSHCALGRPPRLHRLFPSEIVTVRRRKRRTA